MSIGVLKSSTAYKPFRYPWAFEYWQRQQQLHWMPEEVQLGEDCKDWANNLNDQERTFLAAIFRFFTQADLDVNENYMETYAGIFKPHEIKMMLSAFSNMETVHVAAYALLIETVGMPESEFGTFMEYEAMREKHELSLASREDVTGNLRRLLNLAVFGGFIEGVQLFASFAMLMNFQRTGRMKGMCQIVQWSIRDESLHCAGISRLFKTFREESQLSHSEERELQRVVYESCEACVQAEFKFIRLAFSLGSPQNLREEEMKQYVMYLADRRLEGLGFEPIYYVEEHPLPWLVELINGVEHANFFETRATEYSKGALNGSWQETWSRIDA